MKLLKNLIAFSIISLISFSAKAQIPVRAFEFELSGGSSYPLVNLEGKELMGSIMNLELRHNLKNIPIEVGIEFNSTLVDRGKDDKRPNNYRPDLTNSAISLTTSYNFRRGEKYSPFIGIGLGIPVFDIFSFFYGKNDTVGGIPFSPRIGIEIKRHLRFTADFRLLNPYYHTICLRMGIVLGGGKK